MACCKIVWEVSNLFSFVDTRLKYVVSSEGNFPWAVCYHTAEKPSWNDWKKEEHVGKPQRKKDKLGLRNSGSKRQSPHMFCIVTRHPADALPVWKYWGIRWYAILYHWGVHNKRKSVIIPVIICLSWNGFLPRI